MTAVSVWTAAGNDPTFGTNWTNKGSTGNLALTDSDQRFVLEDIDVSSGVEYLAVLIHTDSDSGAAGDGFTVDDVQLEIGDKATAFDRRPETIEQLLCRRYAYRTAFTGLMGMVKNATSVKMSVTIPNGLQRDTAPNPTTILTETDPSIKVAATEVSASGATITGFSQQNNTDGAGFSAALEVDGFTGLTAGQAVIGAAFNGAEFVIISEF